MNTDLIKSVVEKQMNTTVSKIRAVGKGASGSVYLVKITTEPYEIAVKKSKFYDAICKEKDMLDFLSSLGAKVSMTEDSIKIAGATLRSTEFTVIGDMIEAGSYLAAALMTEGKVTVSGIAPLELVSFIDVISDMGYRSSVGDSSITVDSYKNGKALKSVRINAAPYPGFPTDLQPLMAPLLSRCGGIIADSVWPERFGYLATLGQMGLRYMSEYGSAKIEKSSLTPATVAAPDLRGGMALIIAALSAKGTSEILSPEIILRGYDHLEEKLSSLGAEVKLVNL